MSKVQMTRRALIAGTGAAAAATVVPAAARTVSRSLSGKSFLITGTSSGFGRVGALHYARQGARVFATMRNLPRPEGEELARIARDEKLDLHVLPLDVLSEQQVNAAVAEAENINGGPLDVLVNNAGINIAGPTEVQDMAATQLAFDTNVYGYQRTMRAVLPGMRSRKAGLIFNVSSQQGRVVMPMSGLYTATKFAVEAMSEQIAYELAPHGIEVVIIEPGGFPTAIGRNRARYTAELAARAEEKHRNGYPDMVARMSSMPGGGSGPMQVPPGMPDPIEVPRAIAEIAAMPAGTRPLRRPVHPGTKPQLEINRVSAETQRAFLGAGPYAAWAEAVLD
jgi:NAD(P)-dependent dehydrogenase (short-subunit alcohol dehydrogenase family)